jgi:hypothetical protein
MCEKHATDQQLNAGTTWEKHALHRQFQIGLAVKIPCQSLMAFKGKGVNFVVTIGAGAYQVMPM